jgi:HEAT repeat protein
LSTIEPKYIKEKLMLLKHDPDQDFRRCVASSLLNVIARDDVRQALEQYYFIEENSPEIAAIRTFLNFPNVSKTAIKGAVKRYQTGNETFKIIMLDVFGAIPPQPEIFAALLTTLKNDSNPELRQKAARAIDEVYWENQTAKDELKNAMEQDSNGQVRWACLQIFGLKSERYDFTHDYLSKMHVEIVNMIREQEQTKWRGF